MLSKIPLLNLKSKIGKYFLIITLISLIVAFYIGDKKMGAVIFFGYALIKIALNYLKRDKRYGDDYY